jgi:hypothetical protein
MSIRLMIRMSEEIQKSLSSSQILELLQFFHESLEEESIVIPLKAVLSGIKAHEVIEHISPYIAKQLGPSLHKKLRKKDASEELFEIYFLMLELSDNLAVELYEPSVVTRATKLCQASLALFPVSPSILYLMGKPGKKILKPFKKSLRSTLKRLKKKTVIKDDKISLEIVDALVSRWILLIKYLFRIKLLTMSDASSERLQEDFVQFICSLGFTYDYSRSRKDNKATSIRCAELQYQFLMSSDLYEHVGLASTYMRSKAN